MLASTRAGNIGVLFDESLSMVPQMTAMCKSAFYRLRKIRLIRKHLTFDATQLLVQALVSLKLDYCNSLLYGLAKNVIKQLQRVQNAAARVVTLSPKFCHITPVLANLHWLSIYLRIELKILIVTCKPLHGLAPAYIKDVLQSYPSERDLRSSEKNLLVVLAFNQRGGGGGRDEVWDQETMFSQLATRSPRVVSAENCSTFPTVNICRIFRSKKRTGRGNQKCLLNK